jgi:hypothetical protein
VIRIGKIEVLDFILSSILNVISDLMPNLSRWIKTKMKSGKASVPSEQKQKKKSKRFYSDITNLPFFIVVVALVFATLFYF